MVLTAKTKTTPVILAIGSHLDMKPQETSEFEKFDATVKKVISVSHDEIRRREAAWKKKREKKRRAKS